MRPRDADDFVHKVDLPMIAQYQTVDLSNVGSVCLLAYDAVIQLDREVALVWRAEWSTGKLLYLFVRYVGLISQLINVAQWTSVSLSDTFCYGMQLFAGIACQVIVAAVQILLVRRVRAFYMHQRLLRGLLVVFLAFGIIAQVVILGMTMSDLVARGDFGEKGCYTTYYPAEWTEYWVPSLLLETILLAFVIARVIGVVRRGWTPESTQTLVMHDGVLYFVLLFVALLANTLALFLVPGRMAQVGTSWLVSLMVVSGAHMHLSYQEARARLSATPRQKKEHIIHVNDLPAYVRKRALARQDGSSVNESFDTSDTSDRHLNLTQELDTSLDFNSHQSIPARTFDPGALYEPVRRSDSLKK